MPNKTPFCCITSTIPWAFSHLLSLIPDTTEYTPYCSFKNPQALLTSFLTASKLTSVYPVEAKHGDFTDAYKAIIKVTKKSGPSGNPSPDEVSYYAAFGNYKKFKINEKGRFEIPCLNLLFCGHF